MNKESTEVDKAEDRSKTLKADGETVPEILREMRDARAVYDRYRQGGADCDVVDALSTLASYADRIEAARKRERESFGNAAAMREALVQCELFLGNVSRHGHPTLNPGDKCTACDGVDKLRGMVVSALSAPARNCDNYATAEEALKAYQAAFDESNFENGECKLGCPGCDDFPIRCEVRWLFATTKGGEE